jgi:hypothetical protein
MLMSDAADAAKRELALKVAKCPQQMLYWSLRMARAIRTGDYKSISKSISAHSKLGEFGTQDEHSFTFRQYDITLLHDYIRSLAESNIEGEIIATLSSDKSAEDKERHHQKLDVRLKLWRKSCRKSSFLGVRSPSSGAASSASEAAGLLRAHWQGVFTEQLTVDLQINRLLDMIPSAASVSVIIPSAVEIAKYIQKLHDSSPGEDGLPYSAWVAAGDLGAHSIRAVLQAVFDGGRFPDDVRQALLIFIAKDGLVGGHALPDELRPISLGNTDAKIWAGLLNKMFVPLITTFVTQEQKGFMKGRNGIEHVIESELTALEFSRRYPSSA